MARPDPWASSRASWMFTDPYAYQYSYVEAGNDVPTIFPVKQNIKVDSTLCELEGSTPTDIRYELAADPSTANVRDSHRTPDELPKSPYRLSRNSHSITRRVSSYLDRRCHSRSRYAPRAPAQPSSSGLIPIIEDASMPAQRYSPATTAPYSPHVRPSPPAYADGLIPVDEKARTPKEPSSDFDAILRNIGPISRKGKGNMNRERSSRYYDRYSSNFG
ncbi:hypothetical protein F5Y09DRAFT_354584 [Xylaria sp. FL1042]|nr:hypothetical protein F5Y09DRAFT_354584 [Xylaria sp. FL1042]